MWPFAFGQERLSDSRLHRSPHRWQEGDNPYKCKNTDCGYDRQENIPFATGSCGYTHRFAKYVTGLLKSMTLKDTANLLGVTWDTVKDISSR